MVSVKGQLEDSPLLDVGAVKKEYWQRKEVLLPSLAKLMPKKKKGWFGRSKPQTPKIIIRRLTEEEWREIDERFYDQKAELIKNKNALSHLGNKMAEGKSLSKQEYTVINAAQ